MISLCTIGLGLHGCSGPEPFPPNVAIPGQPANMPPSALRVPPGEPNGSFAYPAAEDNSASFAWEPSAQPREWHTIVIHHTAATHGSVESIHEAHLKRKDANGNAWLGIGYHFVIGNGQGMNDGEIEPTFRWREQMQGAHAGAGEYNEHGIGIALVGNFEEAPPTPAQVASVKRLVSALQARFIIPGDKVIGHSDIKATACPGKYFPLDEVRAAGAQALLNPAGHSGGITLVNGTSPVVGPRRVQSFRPVKNPGLSEVIGPGLSPVEGKRSLNR